MVWGPLLPPRKRLGKGDIALSYSPILGGGGFSSPRAPAPPVVLTPWDMAEMMGSNGGLNPGNLILHVAQ